MTDPTLATVDDEPWNQPTKRHAAPVIPIESVLSIYERVKRGGPIVCDDNKIAKYVYDVVGIGEVVQQCENCEASCRCSMWQEWRFSLQNKRKRRYEPIRCFDLCNRCGSALKRLALGERWKGKQ